VKGQFLVGALLGAVWSPCTGPTLGAAIGMAAQSGTQLKAAAIMTLFGLGASAPILTIGYGAQSMLSRNRTRLLKFGAAARSAMGSILVIVGSLVLACPCRAGQETGDHSAQSSPFELGGSNYATL